MQLDLRRRGYTILYYLGESNRCPCCSRSNWIVGRSVAECAFCATALPLCEDHASEAVPRLQPTSCAELAANSEWDRAAYHS